MAVSKHGKPLSRLTQGACFGEMALLGRKPLKRSADVATVTDADIVIVRGEALQKSSEACRMHFYQGVVDVLASRLAVANQRLSSN